VATFKGTKCTTQCTPIVLKISDSHAFPPRSHCIAPSETKCNVRCCQCLHIRRVVPLECNLKSNRCVDCNACTGAASDLSEIQILSLDKRKEAYFCKPIDVKKPNQCKVVNLASSTGDLPGSRGGYAAASTVYTFERSPPQKPVVTILMFLYGGEPAFGSNSIDYQWQDGAAASEPLKLYVYTVVQHITAYMTHCFECLQDFC
jgi:hypothetical protein